MQAGVPAYAIQALGRWASPRMRGFGRDAKETTGGSKKRM
jgi:hypothetical protein